MQDIPDIVFMVTLLIAGVSADKDDMSSPATTGEAVEGEEKKDVLCPPPMPHEDDQ